MENLSRGRTDFHIHYTDVSAREVLEEAKKNGLSSVALVGRAEISKDIKELINYGERLGIRVFSGVEYLAKIGESEFVELICLAFDPNHPKIKKYFGKDSEKQIKLNIEVARKQKELLERKGFTFEGMDINQKNLLSDLLAGKIAEKAIRFCELVTSNKANYDKVRQLIGNHPTEWKEINTTYSEKPGYKGFPTRLQSKFLWSFFFATGREGYVPVLTSASEIINSIHAAGGVVLYSPEGEFNEAIWNKLVEFGVDGIMGWHGGKLEIHKDTIRTARQKGLLILGGSDFNPSKNDWQIGVGAGELYISLRRHEELDRYLANK